MTRAAICCRRPSGSARWSHDDWRREVIIERGPHPGSLRRASAADYFRRHHWSDEANISLRLIVLAVLIDLEW